MKKIVLSLMFFAFLAFGTNQVFAQAEVKSEKKEVKVEAASSVKQCAGKQDHSCCKKDGSATTAKKDGCCSKDKAACTTAKKDGCCSKDKAAVTTAKKDGCCSKDKKVEEAPKAVDKK